MLKVSTFCSGIGSPEVALKNLGVEHEVVLTAEIDKYARQTYLANHSTKKMINDMTEPDYEGEEYYADINISGLPCQAFSLAGKRLGELDPRGLLFFDFYRYVKNQNPKYFIIENVKGLLSDNDGNTFQNWINLLGQSVNGDQFMFPHEDSLMYNLHWQVLNTKDYGLPQNRERVFLIGIRNDLPNDFNFPKTIPLKLRLKDILEDIVDEKYYLSDKLIKGFMSKPSIESFPFTPMDINTDKVCPTITARIHKCSSSDPYLKIQSATKSGYEIATEGDSINLEHPNSQTRRGRVGKQVAQTLTTSCNQGVMVVGFERTEEAKQKRSKSIKEKGIDTGNFSDRQLKLKDQDYSDTILANPNHQKEGLIAEFKIGAMRGRNPENKSDRTTGAPTQQMLEINENGTSNCLTSVQKDNLVVENIFTYRSDNPIDSNSKYYPTLRANAGGKLQGVGLIENDLFNTEEICIFTRNNKDGKTLLELLKEIGICEIEEWLFGITKSIETEEILQSEMYVGSIYEKNKETTNGYINPLQQGKSTKTIAKFIMRSLQYKEWYRCSPQRRKSTKQFIRKFDEIMQKLSYENPQPENELQGEELQYKNKGLWFLRKALSEIQEIRKSSSNKPEGNFRIRKLTPREVFRLQGFPDSFIKPVSSSQLYKQAGNTISVNVIQAILKNLLT